MAQDWAGFSEEELRRLKQNKGKGYARAGVESESVKDRRPCGRARGCGGLSCDRRWPGGAPQVKVSTAEARGAGPGPGWEVLF